MITITVTKLHILILQPNYASINIIELQKISGKKFGYF